MRYYCPQWCHRKRGWIDLPSLASLKRKEAEDAAEQFAKENLVAVHTIRKPKGWESDGSDSWRMCCDCQFFLWGLLGWRCSKDKVKTEHDPTDQVCELFAMKTHE